MIKRNKYPYKVTLYSQGKNGSGGYPTVTAKFPANTVDSEDIKILFQTKRLFPKEIISS